MAAFSSSAFSTDAFSEDAFSFGVVTASVARGWIEVEYDQQEQKDKERKSREERRRMLQTLYRRFMGLPEEAQEELAQVVSPFVPAAAEAAAEKRGDILPAVASVDWSGIIDDLAAVGRLIDIYKRWLEDVSLKLAQEFEDEELILLS